MTDSKTPEALALWRRCQRGEPLTASEFEEVAALSDRGPFLCVHHPDCPAGLLERALTMTGPFPWTCVARHPNLPPERLAEFLASPDEQLRMGAHRNPMMTEAQFRAATGDTLPDRVGLAGNPSLPVWWFDRLILDSNSELLFQLATNLATPPHIQLVLARSPDSKARTMLVLNPRVTPEAKRLAAEFRWKP